MIANDVRQLMDIIHRGIDINEDFARELAEIAHDCAQDGHHDVARGFLCLSRHHRIRGIAGRAKRAALKVEYAPVVSQDTQPDAANE